MKINDIKLNEDNPRLIFGDRMQKLMNSIQQFPKMMKLRPIVVDEQGVIIGGNMRYRALVKLGYKEIPDEWVKRADELTEDEKQEFIIKDNVQFGDWEQDDLANNWDTGKLEEWGVNTYGSEEEKIEAEMPNNPETEFPFSKELDRESNYVVLVFTKDIDWLNAKTVLELESVSSKRQNGKPWSTGIGRVLDGAKVLNKLSGGKKK